MFHSNELHLAYEPGLERSFRLAEPVLYSHGNKLIVVPAGFVTDLASVPRIARALFPGHGRYTPAAIVHDFLYRSGGEVGLYTGGKWRYTRKQADEVFLDAMEHCGVGRISRYTIYSAVRVGGWASW